MPHQEPTTFPSSKSPVAALAVAALLMIGVGGVYLIVRSHQAHKTPAASSSVTVAPAAVSITKTGFVPATISVKAGQAVIWTNTDTAPHSIAAGSPVGGTGLANLGSGQGLSQNDTYSYIFDKAGTYAYHDGTSQSGFSGTVLVK